MKNLNETFNQLKKETFVQEALLQFGEEKLQKFFDRAFLEGHSGGDSEIKNCFRDIIDIANIAVK